MASVTQLVQSSGASSSAQGPSSTAPVLEFTCLFTHDLRRKHKRWQDGRLKFHTYNKRIMVYDERGNTIGDTHWREDHEFGEGEEVDLERGGVVVQAGECVGSRDQDLSELVDKRVQEKVQRQSAAAARHSQPAPSRGLAVVAPQASMPGVQLRHAHLHSVIGTPTGHHGRALVPTESPFQERQKLSAQLDESPRPAKRRRREASPPSKSGYAQSLFGTTLTLSGRPMSSAPVQYQPRKTIQVQRDYDATMPSSDLSAQNNDDVDARQVTSPAETTSHTGHIPLSEKSATATNTARVPADTLIGKNARSKANVPSLLRQTSTREDNKAADASRSQVSIAKKAKRSLNTEPESRIAVPEKTIARSERPRSGLADTPDNIRQTPREPPPSRKSKAHDAAEIGTNLVVDDGLSNNHSRKGAKASAKEDTHQLLPTSNEPHTLPDKPALPGQRIELRMKQTKKRGLLMVSEKAQKKKIRKSVIAADETSGTSGVSCQAVASDLEPGRSFGDEHLDYVSNSKSQRRARQKPAANNDPATQEQDKHSQARGLSGPGKSGMDSISTREHTQRAMKSKAVELGDQQKGRDKTMPPEATPTSKDPRPYPLAPTLRGVASEDQPDGSSDDPLEKTMVRHQLQERASRRTKPSALPPTSAVRIDTQGTFEAEERRETVCSNQEQASEDHGTYIPVDRRVRQGEKHGDANGKMRDPVAPPRLAQLSRKSIRSKEVIGWVYEDNEPLVQMREPTKQNDMSEIQQKPPAAAIPSTADTMRVQLGREAIPPGSKELGNPHPGSLTDCPEHLSKRNSKADISRENGPRVLLGEQDRSASVSHTALADKSPDATATASSREDDAGAPPPMSDSKLQQPLPELTESAIARGEQRRKVLGPAAKDPIVQAIDLHDTPLVEERQVANRPTNVAPHVSAVSAKPADPIVPRHKPTRAVSNPVSRSEVDLATGETQTQTVRTESGRRIDSKPIEQSGSVSKQTGLVSETALERGEPRPDALIDVTEGMARRKEQMPRLVNPATRGRKAAQPTDAAGKVPERVLPPSDAATGIGREGILPSVRIPDKATKEPSALPGFARANGGAWSREAYDLFEYARPS